MRRNLFRHVVVAVGKCERESSFAVFFVQLLNKGSHKRLFLGELLHIVVADYNVDACIRHGRIYVAHMVKALAVFGVLGALVFGERHHKLACDKAGIFHNALCRAGVYAHAFYCDNCGGSIEVLVLYFTDSAAVYGVGKVAAERFDIKSFGTSADLLVRRKNNAQLRVVIARNNELFDS